MLEVSLLVSAFKQSSQVDYNKIHDTLPPLAELSLLLSRSRRSKLAYTDTNSVLMDLLGLKYTDTGDLPVAAYTYFLDTGEASDAWCLRADPVNLQPDRDRLVMINARPENITMADAQAVAQEINHIYSDEPWQFVTPHPQRWYLLLKDDPSMESGPISQVVGQNIHDFLPSGHDQKYWRSLFNEMQMLLHSHSVNIQRSSQNLESINSLWFWGGGNLPKQDNVLNNPNRNGCDHVWTNDALCQGMASYHNIACDSLQQNGHEWLTSCEDLIDIQPGRIQSEHKQPNTKRFKHALVMLDDPTEVGHVDFYDWLQWLDYWQENWLKPMLSGLRSGQIKKLHLHFCNGQIYTISKSDLNKWWRFKRPWYAFTP